MEEPPYLHADSVPQQLSKARELWLPPDRRIRWLSLCALGLAVGTLVLALIKREVVPYVATLLMPLPLLLAHDTLLDSQIIVTPSRVAALLSAVIALGFMPRVGFTPVIPALVVATLWFFVPVDSPWEHLSILALVLTAPSLANALRKGRVAGYPRWLMFVLYGGVVPVVGYNLFMMFGTIPTPGVSVWTFLRSLIPALGGCWLLVVWICVVEAVIAPKQKSLVLSPRRRNGDTSIGIDSL